MWLNYLITRQTAGHPSRLGNALASLLQSRVSDALGTFTSLLCLSTLGGVVTLKSELPSKHCSLGEASRMAATRGATFHDPLRDTPPSEWTDIEICAVECEAVPHDFRKLAVHLISVLFFPF